jgi:hypothetical protein
VKPGPLAIPRSRKFASRNFACSVTIACGFVFEGPISDVCQRMYQTTCLQDVEHHISCGLVGWPHASIEVPVLNRPTTGMLRACECDLPAHGTPMAFEHAYIAFARLRPVCYQREKPQKVHSVTFIDPSILRVLVEAAGPRHYWWNATAPHLASSHKCGPESQAFDGRPALPNITEPRAVVDPPVPELTRLAYLLSEVGQESKLV